MNQVRSKSTKEERGLAKLCGLSVIQYRILAEIIRAGRDGLSYKQIESRTGYYSILTSRLRAVSRRNGVDTYHHDSLVSQGLVRELEFDIDGRTTLVFTITKKGSELMTKAKAATKKKTPKQPENFSGRKIVYPNLEAIYHVLGYDPAIDARCQGKANYLPALDPDKIKSLLGLEEETEENPFGQEFLFIDRKGVKIRCSNNVINRPLYMSHVDAVLQEALNKRWEVNTEPIIIGITGQVLDGQHRLIAFYLANQELEGPNAEYWKAIHGDNPILFPTLVTYGCSEEDKVVNVMNTCKPRSIADVVYRSEFFKGLTSQERKSVSRLTDHCIKLLWHRTGADKDAFAPKRTHAEALDFLSRHQKVVKCISHIVSENAEGGITRLISPGYAAALMYMMASSNTDGDVYHHAESSSSKSEKTIDFSLWDKAESFWTEITTSKNFQPVRLAIANLHDEDVGLGGTLTEKLGVLIKAWGVYLSEEAFTKRNVSLKYQMDDEGFRRLVEFPKLSGIDRGEDRWGDDSDEVKQEKLEEKKEKIKERIIEDRKLQNKEKADKRKELLTESNEYDLESVED